MRCAAPCAIASHLGAIERIGANSDDRLHALTEPVTYLVEGCRATLVLRRVVQERGDGLVLITAVIEHERADSQKVRQVGDRLALHRL